MLQNSIKLLAIISLVAVMFAGSPSADEIQGVASVADGDTLSIQGRRIRLHGIDAPESGQTCFANGKKYRCGKQSAFALSDRIGRNPISCKSRDLDRYGRIVAVCSLGDEDLNAWMVSNGWAVAYRRYSNDYVKEENFARFAGIGIWSGDFVVPEDWRRGKRLGMEEKSSIDGLCDIKGNINQRGEKIFHVPGGRWYNRTKIDISKGERMFCSAEEAVAAGWRKSKQ